MALTEEILTEKWNDKYLPKNYKSGNDVDRIPMEWTAHNLDFVSEAMDDFAVRFADFANSDERFIRYPAHSTEEILQIFKNQHKTT